MEVDQQLPQAPNLNPKSNQKVPPDTLPEPSISILFPEKTPYRAVDNPFRPPIREERNGEYVTALRDALNGIKEPFLFEPKEAINFNGTHVDVDITAENFN